MTLDEIRDECIKCERCELHKTRTNLVFGTGDPTSKVLLVGEAPGKNEDLTGVPFVGRAGALLDTLLLAAGIGRENVYIANILKCRPPDNRDPFPEETAACIGWLRAQYKALSPKIVVCLGRIAAKQLIREDFSITREHGLIYEKSGVKMTAIFHPAALLRNPSYKPLTFEDLLKIKQLIEE